MRKTRLCSLLLVMSMVLSTFVLFVTPAMAAEGSTPAKAPVASVDFSNKTWWEGNEATSFAGGTGTESNPFQIATATQLAFLSKLTSGYAYRPYFAMNGTNEVVFALDGYLSYRGVYGENVYYITTVGSDRYLFSTTDGSTTAQKLPDGSDAWWMFTDASGNVYYAEPPAKKTNTTQAYEYDEASGTFVASTHKVYCKTVGSAYLLDTSSGAALTVAQKYVRYYQFTAANGNAYYTTSVPGNGKKTDAFEYDATTGTMNKTNTMYGVSTGYTFGKNGVAVTLSETACYTYLVAMPGHALHQKAILFEAGESGLFNYNGELFYGWTNASHTNENIYKVAAEPTLADGTYTVSGGDLVAMDSTFHRTFFAHYELTGDIYLNDPTDLITKWNADYTWQYKKSGKFSTWGGDRTDFITRNTNTKLFTPIASSGKFSGTIDGNGYSIYGLAANKNYVNGNVALVATTKNVTIRNLNMAYVAVNQTTQGHDGAAATLIGSDEGSSQSLIDNCHISSANVYGGGCVGGLVGKVAETTITIKNSTFNGNVRLFIASASPTRGGIGGLCGPNMEITTTVLVQNCTMSGTVESDRTSGSNAPHTIGGIVSVTSKYNSRIMVVDTVNYADVTSNTTSGAGGIVSDVFGCTGSGDTEGVVIINCANYGNITSKSGPAGGCVATNTAKQFLSTQPVHGLRVINFANYGTIKGTTAGQVVGQYGMADQIPPHMEVQNAILAGEAIAINADNTVNEAGYAGAIIGTFIDGSGYLGDTTFYRVGFANAYYANNELLYGNGEPANFQTYKATYPERVINTTLYDPASLPTILTTMNGHDLTAFWAESDPAHSWYDKYNMAPRWAMTASTIKAASLELGNNISINLYAQPDHLVPAAVNQVMATQNGVFCGQLTAENTVNVGGVDYLQYQMPVSAANIGTSFVFFLNGGKITYSVLDYATRKYNNNSTEGLDELLEAIVHYGNAAQVAKGVTPTVLDTFAAETGYAYEGDYIADKYADVHFMNNESTFPEGVAVSLALTDGITPVIYVNNSDITHISYTCYEETTEQDIAGETYVVVDKLVATSLNNPVTITFTVAGEEVTGTWNVADFIVAATEANGFTAEQVTLAHALAVYMTTARAYKGLKN